MPALDTVQKMVDNARIMIQDTVVPYRYPDSDLLKWMNDSILEARRLRPDLFLPAFTIPEITALTDSLTWLEPMYRTAFPYYLAGRCNLIDDEGNQDSRAAALMNKFIAQLVTMPA